MTTYEQTQKSGVKKYIPYWLMNRWGAAWGVAGIYLIFYILWTVFHWGATEAFRLIPQWDVDKNYLFITDVTFQPLQLFAWITAWRIAFNRSYDDKLRRAWFFLGLAVAAQLLADSTWMYLEIFLGEPPYPSIADVFYLSYYPLALIGLLTLPGAQLRSEEKLRVLLDLAIVMVATGMVTWFFIISPTSAQYETGQLDQIVATLYPIFDLVVMGGALLLLFRKNAVAVRSMLSIYFLGLVMFVAADLIFAYVSLTGAYISGSWIDVLWITAYAIFALAALRQVDIKSPNTDATLSFQVLTGSSVALPLVAIILGYGMLIYVASEGANANATTQGVFIGAGLLTIFVIGRQALIARQNARLFKEAQALRIAAEQANKAKSAFMANMSHELRTPLNAIIGFTRIVRRKAEGVLPEKQTENLDKVLSSSEHLLGLINTALDIAKIEAGRMDVTTANFDVIALADQCITIATPLLKPGVTLAKQTEINALSAFSDQDKIKQIILNLLSNAAKFTHNGSITLGVIRNDTNIHISVTDSGIGISEDALGKVFEEFQQADSTTTRKYGGTGLGLAISRNLARLLGGDLTVASVLGQGSTFTLTFPTQYGNKSAPSFDVKRQIAIQERAGNARKRILVIDDDPDAAYLMQEMLGQTEFEVTGIRDSATGQQMARENKPDAILLDVMMPGKDGWQVLHDLKADEAAKDIPIILHTIVDKKALGYKLGASAYLLKPLNPSVVIETLRRVTAVNTGQPIFVLVVDDDPHVADMLHQMLPEPDFRLKSAEDGEAGLRAIEAERPHVLILDLMMPKLDGFGVIDRLRKNPNTKDLPIVVISAKELTDEESHRLSESVEHVMKKQGLDGERLVKEIQGVLKN